MKARVLSDLRIRYLCMIALVLVVACGPKIPAEKPDDFQVAYHRSSYSWLPPDDYSFSITIGPDFGGQITFYSGFDGTTWVEDFTVTDADLRHLYERIYDARIFEGEKIQVEGECPGGQSVGMTVYSLGEEYQISYGGCTKIPWSIQAIYNEIEGFVPQEITTRLNAQYEEYVKQQEDGE